MSDSDRSPGRKSIHVVAGVIVDARGRILLARRTEGRDLAGLWEFPGGKVDPGETPEQALVRELREELGIEASVGEAVISVPQQYPDKRLCLDVRRVERWSGSVKGLDGQALAWVPPHKLASYAMPDADRPVVAALRDCDRYLVTPEPVADGGAWLDALARALADGARRVQLRAPAYAAVEPARWRALVAHAAMLAREAGAQTLVNADTELALEHGLGLHLRATQLRACPARPLPATSPVIASCHDLDELQLAQALGCDAAVLGPVLPTRSHPDAPGIGWSRFAELRERVALPIYAIGGMTPAHIAEARRHGGQGIAAIRGLWPC
jgi:8-oxo-dGTP diphosphatase